MARKPKVDIEVNTRQTGQAGALAGVRDRLKELVAQGGISGKALGGMAELAGSAFGKLAIGAGALTVAFSAAKRAIMDFAAAEEQVASLDAALARNAILTDAYRARLQELAGEMEDVSAIADDEWLGVLTRLTQFGVGPEGIDRAVETVKNLAGVVGDLNTATELYVRALSGSWDLFRRYGIQIDATASQTEKLNQLMQRAAELGGGMMEARAQSLTGQLRRVELEVGNLIKTAGGLYVLWTGMGQTLRGLNEILDYWSDKLGFVIPKLDGITNAAKSNRAALEEAEAAARRYSDALGRIERLKAAVGAQNQIGQASMERNLALVDEDLASGRINGAQASQFRAEIRARFREDEFARSQAAMSAEASTLASDPSGAGAARASAIRADMWTRQQVHNLGTDRIGAENRANYARELAGILQATAAQNDQNMGAVISVARKALDDARRRGEEIRALQAHSKNNQNL